MPTHTPAERRKNRRPEPPTNLTATPGNVAERAVKKGSGLLGRAGRALAGRDNELKRKMREAEGFTD